MQLFVACTRFHVEKMGKGKGGEKGGKKENEKEKGGFALKNIGEIPPNQEKGSPNHTNSTLPIFAAISHHIFTISAFREALFSSSQHLFSFSSSFFPISIIFIV